MSIKYAPAHAFRTAEMHIAAASLRRIAVLALLIAPCVAAWLARSAGIATIHAVYIGIGALVAASPLAWALYLAAEAVHASACEADHQYETGHAMTPLNCRG